MNKLGGLTLVTWQGDLTEAPALLESLLVEAQVQREFRSLVVEEGALSTARGKGGVRGEWDRALGAVPTRVPWLSPPDVAELYEALARRRRLAELESRELFVVVTAERLGVVRDLSESWTWAFVGPGPEAPGFLFRVLRSLGPSGYLGLWMVGEPLLEKAVLAYARVLEQLADVLGDHSRVRFLGNLAPRPESLSFAARENRPLVELFPGDGFHGQVRSGLARASAHRAYGGSRRWVDDRRLWKVSRGGALVGPEEGGKS